jgi:hypothetical protein
VLREKHVDDTNAQLYTDALSCRTARRDTMAASRFISDSYGVFIEGRWVEPDDGRYDDICPATEAVIAAAPDRDVCAGEGCGKPQPR